MPAERETITADGAPAAVGPYSHAVRSGDLLFCSGQVALHPETNELTGDTAAEQATRCLQNLEAVCEAAGTKLGNALRLTVYLKDMGTWGEVNGAYEQFFPSDPPARVAFGVAALPKDALVEIDAVVGV